MKLSMEQISDKLSLYIYECIVFLILYAVFLIFYAVFRKLKRKYLFGIICAVITLCLYGMLSVIGFRKYILLSAITLQLGVYTLILIILGLANLINKFWTKLRSKIVIMRKLRK